MTNNNHPITPPPELVEQWCYEDGDEIMTSPRWYQRLCAKSARWGADQELDACCEWLTTKAMTKPWETVPRPVLVTALVLELRATRRPKPPSLKEQALEALNEADQGLNESEWRPRSNTIRRALEQLDD